MNNTTRIDSVLHRQRRSLIVDPLVVVAVLTLTALAFVALL
jgi:hypothetical protein